MSYGACREMSYWDDADGSSFECEADALGDALRYRDAVPKPVAPYNRRSQLIRIMRDEFAHAERNRDDDAVPPSRKAQHAAEHFINVLVNDCLNFSYAISRSGEVNFFFGSERDPVFQLIVDSRGLLSYYGLLGDEELAGDEEVPQQFPAVRFFKLLNAL